MNKTASLRKDLQTLLKTVTPNVHYIQAPEKASFPYIVYEVSEMTHSDGKTLMQLETNVMGYGTDTASIDGLCDELQTKLHKYYGINPYIQYVIYKGLRGVIQEEDKRTIRRRLTFEIQLHEREGE